MGIKLTYTMIEDSIMIDIVACNRVYPGNLSFWVNAKNNYEGLERHSAASLKAHWNSLVKKGKVPYFKAPQNDKESWKHAMENIGWGNEFKIKGEIQGENSHELIKNEEEYEEFTMDKLKNEDEYEEFTMDKLKNEDIFMLFRYLVSCCSAKAGFNVDPELVVQVLDMYQGVVNKTIQYFEHKS